VKTWADGRGASTVVQALMYSPERLAIDAERPRTQSRVGIVHIQECTGTVLRTIVSKRANGYAGPRYQASRILDRMGLPRVWLTLGLVSWSSRFGGCRKCLEFDGG